MAKIAITFRDEKPPVTVALGAFAQIAAKRRYGLEVARTDDPEFALFGCFVELAGPVEAAKPEAFDAWLMTVDDFDVVTTEPDPADPSEAETPSSTTSPGSPPTSE